jgi:hypothetical protein
LPALAVAFIAAFGTLGGGGDLGAAVAEADTVSGCGYGE